MDRMAERGIDRDAALEDIERAVLADQHLAEQIEVDGSRIVRRGRGGRRLDGEPVDDADDDGPFGRDLDHGTNLHGGVDLVALMLPWGENARRLGA